MLCEKEEFQICKEVEIHCLNENAKFRRMLKDIKCPWNVQNERVKISRT